MLGVGAVAGAVYVTEFATEFPLAHCVLIALSTPQEEPLQPGPLSDQDSTVLGFELGTGVSVETIVALLPAGTFDGAESCSVKLLVINTVAEICFEGSAMLCAVTVALAGEGRNSRCCEQPARVQRSAGGWTRAAGQAPADGGIGVTGACYGHLE